MVTIIVFDPRSILNELMPSKEKPREVVKDGCGKTDSVKPIENPIELLEQLQGVRYDWKAEQGGQPDIGFIAEDVGKVFPEIVAWEEDGINARGLNYGHLVAVAVEGIKAQQTEIETLRKEKADMETRLARLEALLLDNPQLQAK